MRIQFPSPRKFLRWFLVAIVALALLVYIVLPFSLGTYATLPHTVSVGAPPDGFESRTLTTEDDVKIAVWYAPAQNGAVIILVPGANGTRKSVRGYATFLHKHGFGVLALDLRGNGESTGQPNQFGWNGTRDIGAAIQFLQTQADVKAIGALGTSLGGEVLLGAASAYPILQAIVSDGASFRSIEEYTDLEYQRPIYRNFTTRVMFFAVGLWSGDAPPLPIRASMIAAQNTKFLLIAGGRKPLEVDYNEMFANAVGERATFWIVQDVGHVGAFGRYPDEYEQRVIAFFETTLLSDLH